jgi:hypothetical protein
MLHVWLIPVVVVVAVALGAFYLVVRFRGGSGVRTEGKTLFHEPTDTPDLPPE